MHILSYLPLNDRGVNARRILKSTFDWFNLNNFVSKEPPPIFLIFCCTLSEYDYFVDYEYAPMHKCKILLSVSNFPLYSFELTLFKAENARIDLWMGCGGCFIDQFFSNSTGG